MSGGILLIEMPVAQLIVEIAEDATTVLVASEQTATLTAVEEQGPSGPAETGFGQITYTERELDPEDAFAAFVRKQMTFNAAAMTVQDALNSPFVGHVFWNGSVMTPREMGDLYEVQVNLIVSAAVEGGLIRCDADVGSSLGPIASATQALLNGALDPERVTFILKVQVLRNFLANGCRFFLTSTVPITVVSETVLIEPRSIQATP